MGFDIQLRDEGGLTCAPERAGGRWACMASQPEACRRLGRCPLEPAPSARRPADQVPRSVILLHKVEREAGMSCASCGAGRVGEGVKCCTCQSRSALIAALMQFTYTKAYKRTRTPCGSMLCVPYRACSFYCIAEGLIRWVHSFAAILCMFNSCCRR